MNIRKDILTALFSAFVVGTAAVGSFGQVAGTWTNGTVGAVQYQNRVTGATKSGRGSIFTYKFHPNGTYEFTGYMEVTMYSCTTTLFNQISGRYKVSDGTVALAPSRDFWKNTNSCAAIAAINSRPKRRPTSLTISGYQKMNTAASCCALPMRKVRLATNVRRTDLRS